MNSHIINQFHLNIPLCKKYKYFVLIVFSYRNGAGFSRTPYMVRTPCAKSLSIVYDLYQDFDLNKDSSVSKV